MSFSERKKIIDSLPVDMGGHFALSSKDNWLIEDIKLGCAIFDSDVYKCLTNCNQCGEYMEFTISESGIVCKNPCKYPKGYPAYEFELNVPSGKMVVGNNFTDKFNIVGCYDINSVFGKAKTSYRCAEIGMAHAYVGNTCPGFFKINNNSFYVGNKGRTNPIPKSRRVGGIGTNLWWYSIVDYDQYVLAYGEKFNDVDIVKCKPGVYRFKHQHHLSEFIYTYIDWVREPDAIIDFKAKQMERNITAGQALYATRELYPSLYPDDMEGVISFANQELFSSQDYHPNGWFCSNPDVDNDYPSADIPIFNVPVDYRTITKNCWLAEYTGVGKVQHDLKIDKLNDSFIELAFNLLQAYVNYGVRETSVDWINKQIPITIELCKEMLNGLAKRHPDKVPNYVKLDNK